MKELNFPSRLKQSFCSSYARCTPNSGIQTQSFCDVGVNRLRYFSLNQTIPEQPSCWVCCTGMVSMSNFLRQTGSQHCLSVLVFSVLDMNPKGNVAAPETVNRGHDRSLYYSPAWAPHFLCRSASATALRRHLSFPVRRLE